MQLRRHMSSFSSTPVVCMPFPPGPAHNPALSTLPSLNWEAPAIQLCLEAYLFMTVISYPKRVSYARYGQIPLGNLGDDENVALYDTSLSRLIEKNRALSWASRVPGKPDVGENFVPSSDGGTFPVVDAGSVLYSQDDIWEDDDELVSPVIRRPGVYRAVCVDIEVQDLAIAALSEMAVSIASIGPGAVSQDAGHNANSPNNVALFDDGFTMAKTAGPLGDEMSTSISLPIVRALVSGWLRDAFSANSLVADELLHHIYRLVSDPETLLFDPALHRVVHALMKSTFLRVLGELQRLGCSIVYASFHRITVATNKIELADAEEYINFVISTARKGTEEGNILSKVSLRPKQFHTHFVFLDEYNFGTMQLERLPFDEIDDADFILPEGGDDATMAVVPSVVTGWSLTNYLGSGIAQEYFRALIGRFSKEVMKKQMDLHSKEDSLVLSLVTGNDEDLMAYRKKQISKHFATYLTRAVDEILKDGPDDAILPPLLGDASRPLSPALEFIKNLIKVLELDPAVEKEVQALKRSLLTQVDVAEYSQAAVWTNPCPKFILPDVFCGECQDSRDVNLCYIPPREPGADEQFQHDWVCEDCGTPYDITVVEHRLVHLAHLKLVRYQLQDLRCKKTKRVATRALAFTDNLQLDNPPDQAYAELRLLHSLAELHGLETLRVTTTGVMASYQ
jgi:DNA polymerase epsilon subunit 1